MSYGFITSNISSGGYKNIPVYSAGSGVHHLLFHLDGLDVQVPTLNSIRPQKKWHKPKDAVSAIIMAKSHLEKLECYACHSAWAPQCYGCHVKVDYSKGKESVAWIASGNIQLADGHTAESRRDGSAVKTPGKTTEARRYLRWENPVVGINGEGRVSPIIPGCQQITTVIGPAGKPIVLNKIWRTAANLENSGPEGQRGIDMAPVAPHTRARKSVRELPAIPTAKHSEELYKIKNLEFRSRSLRMRSKSI